MLLLTLSPNDYPVFIVWLAARRWLRSSHPCEKSDNRRTSFGLSNSLPYRNAVSVNEATNILV
jgi:hypothetical protein